MPHDIPFLQGLRSVAPMYDAFIVDLWGVVYEENKLCYGVFNALSQLKEIGKEVIFLSNSPHRIASMTKKLERIGLKRHLYQGLLTAGEVIYHEMRSKTDPFFAKLGNRCFHLGPDEFWTDFSNLNYIPVPSLDEADFLLVTGTFGTQDSLSKYDPFFKVCLSRRLPMICACPDPFILKDGDILIGAGALAAQYQSVGGKIFWKGKPEACVFEYCLEGLKTKDRNRIAVIGDSCVTDIAGANFVGLDAFFVTGGVHSKDLKIKRGDFPNPSALNTLLRQYDCQPKAVLPAFLW